MKTHNEFMERVKEKTKEPTLPERTRDALKEYEEKFDKDGYIKKNAEKALAEPKNDVLRKKDEVEEWIIN